MEHINIQTDFMESIQIGANVMTALQRLKMEIDCPVCKGKLIDVYKIGYVHKEFTTPQLTPCQLDDGMQLVEDKAEDNKFYYAYHVKDVEMRSYFLRKLDELLEEERKFKLEQQLELEKQNSALKAVKKASLIGKIKGIFS